jgi:hypothetical protein
LFVPRSKFGSQKGGVELAEKPVRVWTAIPPAVEPKLPQKMRHLENGFLEDQTHDWSWTAGKFRFYSRVTEGDCWIILEYP